MADIIVNGPVGATIWQRRTIRLLEEKLGESGFLTWIVHDVGLVTGALAASPGFFTILNSGKVCQNSDRPALPDDVLEWVNTR